MLDLDRLTVRGFTSIRALEDFRLGALNVLIGPNGGGKSNFIALFAMAAALARGRLQAFTAQHDGADALLFGGRKRTGTLAVELAFRGCAYRFSLAPAGNRLVFAREEVQGPEDGGRTVSFGGGHRESELGAAGEGDDRAAPPCPRETMAAWRAYRFAHIGAAAALGFAHSARDNLRLQTDGGNLASFLRLLRRRHPHEYREIVEVVRLAVPFFGDFVYREEAGEWVELEWLHADDPDTVLTPRQLSDGALRFACLATLLLQPARFQPNPILIDEPELGLHPHAIGLLAELLRHASDTRKVVVSTQSADLVNELEPEDVVVVNRERGESIFERLDSERLGEWLEDYTLGDLWRAYVVGGGPGR